jgi:4a-hydroxytetrahydrobiopterin dehydratase
MNATMARPARLDEPEIARRLAALPGWQLVGGKLHRDFVFRDFVEAFRFMTGVAIEAERLNHHPEWSNVYNRVTIDLVTHDAQGITALDFDLAERAARLAEPAR